MGKTIDLAGFPYLVSEETVKELVEQYTGTGTVYLVQVKEPRKKKSRVYARVQFTTVESADLIISLAKQRLIYYETSYLKAYPKKFDIEQEPKEYVHHMEAETLYFGCQTSKNTFSVLWKCENVSVEFWFHRRKLCFFLSYLSVEYKLELLYENIWQIELHCPPDKSTKFLLIQLFGACRIYKKCEESVDSYSKETPCHQWVKETDFTPSFCLGQSSALCLELPSGVPVLNFSEYFPYYKENEGPFILESGFTFSCNLDLVPIVGPPHGLDDLPYKILFKICILVQQGCLAGPTLDNKFYQLHSKECCYEPVRWLQEQYIKYLTSRKLPKTPDITLDNGLMYVHRVQITPCKVFFSGPEVNMSNREFDKLFSTDLSPRVASSNEETRTGIYRRILSILRDGIVIGNKKFDFLAFSSSQLKGNSVWMFASSDGVTAADIRKWMGDFRRIRNVAKYAARLGQSFSSSRETLSVSRHEIETIPDAEVVTGGNTYVFSDGIGKISADFAWSVAKKCGLEFTPSAFQIRYGGYKGVVAVDPSSSMKMSLRMSMCKYESDHTKLDVLRWSGYMPSFLNRQFITLLSTLGVEDHIFEKRQSEVIEELDNMLTDSLRAWEALELMCPGENTNILKEMLLCGYKPDAEPFLSMMLQTFRAAKLLGLRTKARIFIPKGRFMLGCLDETRTLEYGQVFVQISGVGHKPFYDDSLMPSDSDSDQPNFIVRGKVFVAKNPCLHPGDVRVLNAVNVPALQHMVDCVVFPQRGSRPHPNECSGSDLDGDIYSVCWDPDLIPPQQVQPMDYTPAPSVPLDHDVTIEEVQEYFANYIVNNSLGIISNAHIVFADKEPSKAMSDPCIALAKLSSIAVDFAKTGVPAEIPPDLRVQEYPDFMEKSDKSTYESKRVLGKLFRAVKDISPQSSSIKSFTKEVAENSYDPDMEVDGFEDYIDDAFDYKNVYDDKLGNLMDCYGIKTEGEILSGSIMTMSKFFDQKKLRKMFALW
ncbi:RNA-dependent RNA polymerase 1 [Camellia lanceoleosa]|uniref:RNA-dependent RNA polymerase 1 n=1 Tax=Camellia lanceoleosa TaxID=1840588 RepID=A0ACC0G381_9ERIC|nr:RNA-dependent RNA polymerase 1 [Camellia lanceoleosa]